MSQEKMSLEKKTKLIYSGELMLFAILFLVLATLEILSVIGKRNIMLTIFNFVTTAGGTWMIVDFFWVLFSKKRRAKNSLLDKILLVPLGIYLITFDIICFCKMTSFGVFPEEQDSFRRLMMGIAFYYIGAIYLFQSIYHYFVPVPSLIKAIEDAYKAEQEEQEKERLAALKDQEVNKDEAVDAEVEEKKEEKDL